MIKILTRADRAGSPELFDQMFRARAAIFRDRLGWDVEIRDGWEIDHYDTDEDPIYVVSLDDRGRMTGSLRLLPTTGETMLRNEFSGFFTEPVDVTSPLAWECTRFCVHPQAYDASAEEARRVSTDLLIALCDLALHSGIEQIVGLYDNAMPRIYRRIGWSPVPLAHARPEIGALTVGIWDVSPDAIAQMRARLHSAGAGGEERRAA
jgi:N-acyl-L-homoserine lactone synthetase